MKCALINYHPIPRHSYFGIAE